MSESKGGARLDLGCGPLVLLMVLSGLVGWGLGWPLQSAVLIGIFGGLALWVVLVVLVGVALACIMRHLG